MKKIDLPGLLQPLRDLGWSWKEDGKLHCGPTAIADDSPWISQNLDFDCYLWNKIFHHTAAQGKMVHTHCQTCLKIVVAPRTFRELIALEKYQEQCGMRCKCGVEVRDFVARNYGGYFYSWEPGDLNLVGWDTGEGEPMVCRVVDDGDAQSKAMPKYERIVKDMAEHVQIEDDPIPVILKRGCTEFETHCGPTNEPRYRHISDEQMELEEAIDEHVAYTHGHFVAEQPEVVKEGIRMRWCEFAHSRGDMTYVEWLGHSLTTPPVTYHVK